MSVRVFFCRLLSLSHHFCSRFMTYYGGKFYITDLGRDLIIILESKGHDDNRVKVLFYLF